MTGFSKGESHPHVDPTAGVSLWPVRFSCDRCGLPRSTPFSDPRRICEDCSRTLKPEERKAWRRAA